MPYLVMALVLLIGAAGLFLTLPGRRADVGRAGVILLLAAGAGILYAASHHFAGPTLAGFTACAAVALFAGVRVITHKQPVYSALYFVLLVAAVTGLLVVMQAQFLAAALLLIYAGAILVTYVFVIMLAQQARLAPYDALSREPLLGVLAGFVLLAALVAQWASVPAAPATAAAPDAVGTVEAVGTPLLTNYIVGVELAGVLLLAAMVGAIAVARRRPQLPLEAGQSEAAPTEFGLPGGHR